MRIYFQNASIPTRAEKRLKLRLSLKESQARQITAEVFGYADWTDLHNAIGGTAASPLDETCDAKTLADRRQYQSSQLVASSVDLHGETPEDFIRWWQPSAANSHDDERSTPEPLFAGSEDDLRFHEALNMLVDAAHHSVGQFEEVLLTGIHKTENDRSLRLAESITDELLSGNRNREPEVARHLLEALALRGLSRSILNLSTSLATGDGGPKDEKRARDLLVELANSAATPDDLKRIVESRLSTASASS